MKITKRDLLNLYNGMCSLEGRQFSVKFSYFIAKNKVAIRDEITALDEARRVSNEFKLYDDERVELARKFADKSDDGSAKVHDNSFIITKLLDGFQKNLSKLREKHTKAIEKREKQIEDFENLLNETATFEKFQVEFDDIPPTIEPSILEGFILADLIIDE